VTPRATATSTLPPRVSPIRSRIVTKGDKQGTVTFNGWGAPVDVSAPSDAIDLSQL